MAANAEVFKARLKGHGERLHRKALLVVEGVHFKLYSLIISAPEHKVDTGRMRAGWAMSVRVAGGHLPPPVKRTKVSRGTVAAPNPQEFLVEVTGAPLEAKRIVYNNVEYAIYVELGSETQEGQHVARLAIQRLIAA